MGEASRMSYSTKLRSDAELATKPGYTTTTTTTGTCQYNSQHATTLLPHYLCGIPFASNERISAPLKAVNWLGTIVIPHIQCGAGRSKHGFLPVVVHGTATQHERET